MKLFILIFILITSISAYALFKTGDKLPDHTAYDVTNDRIMSIKSYVELQKENTMILFWSRSCGICVDELPRLESYKKPLITACSADDRESLKRYVKSKNLHFIVLAGDREMMKKYQIRWVPTWFIVNKNMKIIDQGVGTPFDE